MVAVTAKTRTALRQSLVDSGAADNLIAAINGANNGPQQAAVAKPTITASAGSLPSNTGVGTVSDASAPTNLELLGIVVKLNKKIGDVIDALHNYGVTA